MPPKGESPLCVRFAETGVTYPRELDASLYEGLPEGWKAIEYEYKSGIYLGKTYVRFKGPVPGGAVVTVKNAVEKDAIVVKGLSEEEANRLVAEYEEKAKAKKEARKKECSEDSSPQWYDQYIDLRRWSEDHDGKLPSRRLISSKIIADGEEEEHRLFVFLQKSQKLHRKQLLAESQIKMLLEIPAMEVRIMSWLGKQLKHTKLHRDQKRRRLNAPDEELHGLGLESSSASCKVRSTQQQSTACKTGVPLTSDTKDPMDMPPCTKCGVFLQSTRKGVRKGLCCNRCPSHGPWCSGLPVPSASDREKLEKGYQQGNAETVAETEQSSSSSTLSEFAREKLEEDDHQGNAKIVAETELSSSSSTLSASAREKLEKEDHQGNAGSIAGKVQPSSSSSSTSSSSSSSSDSGGRVKPVGAMVKAGDLKPLEHLDAKFMTDHKVSLAEVLLEARYRELTYRYLILKRKANMWWPGVPDAYFNKQEAELRCENAKRWLEQETQTLVDELLLKGSFGAPHIFLESHGNSAIDDLDCQEVLRTEDRAGAEVIAIDA